MSEAIRALVTHMKWADERTLHALKRARPVPPRALSIYAHVLGSEHTWLSRLRGTPPVFEVWPALDIPACERLADENHRTLAGYVDGISEGALEGGIAYTNTKGESFHSRVADILLHMAQHGSYHRGQVALLLRMDDIDPIATDYIVYTRTS